jgi:hypothetical protein
MNNRFITYLILIFVIFFFIIKKSYNIKENYFSPITKSTSNFKNNNHTCPYVFNCPTRIYPNYDLRGDPFNPNFFNHFNNKLFPFYYNHPYHPLSLHPVYWTNIDEEEISEILNNKNKKNKKKKVKK